MHHGALRQDVASRYGASGSSCRSRRRCCKAQARFACGGKEVRTPRMPDSLSGARASIAGPISTPLPGERMNQAGRPRRSPGLHVQGVQPRRAARRKRASLTMRCSRRPRRQHQMMTRCRRSERTAHQHQSSKQLQLVWSPAFRQRHVSPPMSASPLSSQTSMSSSAIARLLWAMTSPSMVT